VVRLDVLASDDRRPIAGLGAEDFEVLDNGKPQAVQALFGEQEPLDILFAFDRSASTNGRTIRYLRESARAILSALAEDDRAGLLAFNHGFHLAAPLGPPISMLSVLDTIEPSGSTALLDAASVALNLTAAADRRTMVLLFTDGTDTASWLPERLVLDAARGSEAVLYAVAMQERSRLREVRGGDHDQLRRLAEATGGRLLRTADPTELRESFLNVLTEMRARYVLSYTPSNTDAGWHAVSVRLRNRAGQVSTRDGYVVPAR
jgi:VWFA-related protein